jgi:lipopolysaccharide transport system ATP-binding protein
MNEVLIRAEGVSKKYSKDLKKSLWYGLKDVFGSRTNSELRPSEFWAVRDLSFEVRRGECLGLIGHNGAGKSTLLKMLNGLLRPDTGQIEMKGRVGALIELGAGFNPILTGRENIYNNAAILGFSKKETDKKLEEIIEFAEIEEFLDMPVQNYSSGMRVRLGFAVAAQMEPDIMLIDEVLAVGDIGFVLKCFNKMDKLMQNSALVLVSHSMPQISRMCTQLLLMDKGQSIFHSEDVSAGITEYYDRFSLDIKDYKGSETANLISVKMSSRNQTYISSSDEPIFDPSSEISVLLTITCIQKITKPDIYLSFYDREQRNFAEVMNFNQFELLKECVGTLTYKATFRELPLSQGKYSLTVGFSGEENGARVTYFRSQSAFYFSIHSQLHGWAPIQFTPQWKISD